MSDVGRHCEVWFLGERYDIMENVNRIINFTITKGEDGFYVASADEEAIFTQGKTFEELVENIKEAVEVSIDDGEDSKSFPPVMMNMDFSKIAYA